MPALYDAADIYLTATDLDNMPGSITECMAAGLPVVTTDSGGIPYIVTNEETCLMVPRNDHSAMAAAAVRMLEDNDLAVRIGEAARQASKKFTWNAVRQDWINLYHELVLNPPQDRATFANCGPGLTHQISPDRDPLKSEEHSYPG
jgi:glycosyltransferase involved in cell wall biosynthesis